VQLDEGISIEADIATNLGMRVYRYRSGLKLEPVIEEVRRRLRPGQVFVDGGANIGLFTLYSAARVGATGRVLAFEPAPQAVHALTQNVRLNRFDWVDVIEAALSDRAGRKDFVDFGEASGLSSFAPEHAGGTRISVRTITLDEVAIDTEAVGIVKLDLEGAEVAALRGASQLLNAGVPFIVEVEEQHLQRQRATADEVFEIFGSRGYRWRKLLPGPNVLFEAERAP
jgi:FkbM family methyltransferase